VAFAAGAVSRQGTVSRNRRLDPSAGAKLRLGYEDVASFARAFRKAVGSVPGAYRKSFGRKGVSPADFAANNGSRQNQHLFEAGGHGG
jgi:hypothetical protein